MRALRRREVMRLSAPVVEGGERLAYQEILVSCVKARKLLRERSRVLVGHVAKVRVSYVSTRVRSQPRD